MTAGPHDLQGDVLAPLVDAALRPDEPRAALYRALLEEPLCLGLLPEDAPPGPQTRLPSGESVRLVEAPALRVPVVPLYCSGAALAAAAAARGYWPDGVERARVLEAGAAFSTLRGHPGALIVADEGGAVPLDAGEVAALGERLSPEAYVESLRALLQRNKGREVARRLARRPLYVLGHPRGGLLMFPGEIPAFFHLAAADRFAARIAAQSGERAEHGLVAAADLFMNACRGKLTVVLDPGPRALRLKHVDLRV